jgi:hypothetical protein
MQRARPITIAQEDDGQREHQNWTDNPVLQQRQAENFPIAEDVAQLVVVHLRQRRIHHEDEADGDWYRGRADAHAVEDGLHAGEDCTERDPGRHREKNPQREVAIEKREPAQHRRLR